MSARWPRSWRPELATTNPAAGVAATVSASARRRADRLALVVPTKDRPREVRRLLESLRAQSVVPARVVVVDAGDGSLAPVATEFADLDVMYVRAPRPGLTRQKNLGVEHAGGGVDLIGFVDDDIVFEAGALEAMLGFWRDAGPEVGGASFNIVNAGAARSWLVPRLLRMFLMSSDRYGTVLRSGFNTPITNTPATRFTEWLNGGSTVWRRDIFRQHRFAEWFPGSGLCEDVWFSRRVHPRYRMAVVAPARVQHQEVGRSIRGEFGAGRAQVLNRLYVVRSDPRLSMWQCLYALTGQLVLNVALGVATRDRGLLLRAAGNVSGFARALRPRTFETT
jgi:glycosyltransferase involved in cell wall biosynthesis